MSATLHDVTFHVRIRVKDPDTGDGYFDGSDEAVDLITSLMHDLIDKVAQTFTRPGTFEISVT